MFCVDCITTSDLFVLAGVTATLMGVGIALFLGVGGWRRDTSIRKQERVENRRTFSTLLAHDIRRLQNQGRDVRDLLEEARFGPTEGKNGAPINVFRNLFSGEHSALMILTPISLMEQSIEWAKHLPHEEVKIACALSSCVRGWNEKAQLLDQLPREQILPPDLSDDLVFILDRIAEKTAELLPRLGALAGPNL